MTGFAPRPGMSAAEIAETVAAIVAEETLEEKVGTMSGHGFFKAFREDGGRFGARPYRAGGGIERLGVPAFWFTDGPRGVARGNSTCFPCTMARGASFDLDLETRIGAAMGIEARAQGCNLSGAVPRHGRVFAPTYARAIDLGARNRPDEWRAALGARFDAAALTKLFKIGRASCRERV